MINHGKAPHIVVIGGGFAGIESALALRSKLGAHARITLLTDQENFLFKPHLIYLPFGMSVERVSIPLKRPMSRAAVDLYVTRVRGIDAVRKQVSTEMGEFGYDYLIVASGAGAADSHVPGAGEFAHSVWTVRDMLRLRRAFLTLSEAARQGERREVLFALPTQPRCPTPLYEVALMLDTWLRRQRIHDSVHLTFVTGEKSYLQDFGTKMHDLVLSEFEQRRIDHFTDAPLTHVTPDAAQITNGLHLPYDLLITFPQQAANIRFEGLPADEHGFINVDPASRQVKEHPEIYAVGDASDFPLKMGYLASAQADAAADHLSAHLHGREARVHFKPTAVVMLDTLDRAAFVRVPLNGQGKTQRYRVGVSPTWRMSKQVLGVYVPWRVRAGKPFNAGLPYQGMSAGLKALTGLFSNADEEAAFTT